MKALKQSRIRLGITQEQMAIWLGVSSSLYSMAEIGQRDLPMAAFLKLAQLATTDSGKQAAPALPPKVAAEEQQALHNMLSETRYEIARLQRKLKKMEAAYETCGPLQQLLRQIAPAKKTASPTLEQLWAPVMEATLNKKLQYCGPGRQLLLRAELAGLAAKAEHLEATLQAYG